MNLISIIRRVTLCAAIGIAVASTPTAGAEPVKLKMSSFESPMGNITANVLTPFAREVSAASEGSLQIDVYAGGTLGRNPVQQLKLVTDGVADLAWVVMAYTPGRFDDTDVVGLPFISNSSLESGLALNRLYSAGDLVGFEGLKMLVLGATSPVNVHGNLPVRLPADFRNRRVRASGEHLSKIIEHLGGAPVQLAGGQIAEGLSRGVVDITLNNWGFIGDFKVNEVTSQHLDIALGAVALGIVMRQDRYAALPPAARAAIDKFSGEPLARKLGEAFDRQDAEVRAKIAKSGRNTVITPGAAELAQWKQAIEPVNLAWRQAKPRNERVYQAFIAQLGQIRAAK